MSSSATDPDEAFREKTLRILVAVHVFIAFAIPLYNYIRLGVWHWLHPVVMLLILAGAITAITRRRLVLAAYLMLAAGYWVGFGSFLLLNVWALSFSSTHTFLMWGGVLTLPKRYARFLPYLVVILYTVMLVAQPLVNGSSDQPSDFFGIISSVGSMVIAVFVVWKGINYLMSEFRQQRDQLVTLVQTLEARVAERTNDLEAAVKVSHDVATDLTMGTAIQTIATQTQRAYNLSGVAIYAYDAETGALDFAFASGVLELLGASVPSVSLGDVTCHLSQAARERQPLTLGLNDVCTLPPEIPPPVDGSALLLPLYTRADELMGVFILAADAPDHFVSSRVHVFTLLATHLAGSMKNAQLYDAQVAATERLKSLDQLKSQFLAGVTHELKTPLNISLNFTEFVLEGLYGPVNDRQHDALSKAHDNGEMLLDLINALLDLSRIESGMTLLHLEPDVDLNVELADIRVTTNTLLKDKPVLFVEDIDPDLPLLTCDRRRLQQICFNLLSNAVKFTDVGSITLSAKRIRDGVLLVVTDTGYGIALSDQETIFEPFRQTLTGVRRGGSGLGLAIVRGLVEAHGGTITVRSEPGQGSEFYVTLPLKPPAYAMQSLRITPAIDNAS